VLDGARQAPLSEDDYEKLKEALHALRRCWCGRAARRRPAPCWESRKAREAGAGTEPETDVPHRPDMDAMVLGRLSVHGRLRFACAVEAWGSLPGVRERNVYGQKEPKVLVRIVGQSPLAATVYSLERLRCGACGQVYTAQEPEGVGPEKYDETAAAMIAQLKYGSGTPFYRLEQSKVSWDSVTGGDAMGSGRRGGRVTQTGARRVNPAGCAR